LNLIKRMSVMKPLMMLIEAVLDLDLLHRGDCLNRGMCDEVSKFFKRLEGL
jgi:hypothetical protein